MVSVVHPLKEWPSFAPIPRLSEPVAPATNVRLGRSDALTAKVLSSPSCCTPLFATAETPMMFDIYVLQRLRLGGKFRRFRRDPRPGSLSKIPQKSR